ncbi:MAG: DUF4129 domain-containing protein [Methanomassiliicoccales archaeon]|nr:DUF4129 domain-containing protein [Methanomassiliicoccales archaeon]
MGVVGRASDAKLIIATLAVAVVVIAVGLMVANIGRFDLGEGGEPLGPEAYAVAEILAYTLVPIFLFIGLWLVLSGSRRKGARGKASPTGSRSMAGYIALMALVGAVIIFASLTDGQIIGAPGDGDGDGVDEPEQEEGPVVAPDGGQGSLLILGFLIVIAVLGLSMVPRYLRSRPVLASRAAGAMEMRRAKAIVDKAVDDLYAGEDARSVIVRTYQSMSRLVAARLSDSSTLTPRELAAIAEGRFRWPRGPTEELTVLFEEAWYSDHAMSEEKKERALRCLGEISTSFHHGGGDGRAAEAVHQLR